MQHPSRPPSQGVTAPRQGYGSGMPEWAFPLLLATAAGVAAVNTRLAVRARTPEQERLAAIGLLCEVISLAAVVSTVLVG